MAFVPLHTQVPFERRWLTVSSVAFVWRRTESPGGTFFFWFVLAWNIFGWEPKACSAVKVLSPPLQVWAHSCSLQTLTYREQREVLWEFKFKVITAVLLLWNPSHHLSSMLKDARLPPLTHLHGKLLHDVKYLCRLPKAIKIFSSRATKRRSASCVHATNAATCCSEPLWPLLQPVALSRHEIHVWALSAIHPQFASSLMWRRFCFSKERRSTLCSVSLPLYKWLLGFSHGLHLFWAVSTYYFLRKQSFYQAFILWQFCLSWILISPGHSGVIVCTVRSVCLPCDALPQAYLHKVRGVHRSVRVVYLYSTRPRLWSEKSPNRLGI